MKQPTQPQSHATDRRGSLKRAAAAAGLGLASALLVGPASAGFGETAPAIDALRVPTAVAEDAAASPTLLAAGPRGARGYRGRQTTSRPSSDSLESIDTSDAVDAESLTPPARRTPTGAAQTPAGNGTRISASRTAKPPRVPALSSSQRAGLLSATPAAVRSRPAAGRQMPLGISLPNPGGLPAAGAASQQAISANRSQTTVAPLFKPRTTTTAATPQRTASVQPNPGATNRPAMQPSPSRLNVRLRPNMSKSERDKARVAAYKDLKRRSSKMPKAVPPPVPMSLRPGHGTHMLVQQQERIAPVTLPSAPPPAPPAGEIAASPQPLTAPQKPAASLPPVGKVVAAQPKPAATPGKPLDLTAPVRNPFRLEPLEGLPVVMSERSELFPADDETFVDPELRRPQATQPPTRLSADVAAAKPLTGGSDTFVIPPLPGEKLVVTTQPAKRATPQPLRPAPQKRPTPPADEVATVSIASLQPKAKPLPVAPQAKAITAAKETVPEFALPKLTLIPTETGLAGFCPVALHRQRKLVDADGTHEAVYLGRLYRFADAESLKLFQSTPNRFAPAARGRDVVMLATGAGVEDGALQHAVWYRGRLYLFASASTMKEFTKTPSRYLASN